ncbi:MAG TPA: DNA repair protein RecN [Acidobacteriota bacterium]|nr:DNA repair protein RecN [Acidobacteriota bacterium]
MIKFLRVRNLATIEDLTLEFADGFSVLTGETGAGKSILIDAVRLLLGEKGSSDYVRTGASEASVEALFEAPPGALPIPGSEGDGILVQRQISAQGTGKAYVNGVLVPARVLKDAGAAFADIYGQNDHVFLLHLENHRGYLDALLDARALREEVALAARELRSALRQKQDLEARGRDRAQRLDLLAFQIREIEAGGLKPGEDEELSQTKEVLKNAGKIATLIDQAIDLSYAGEESLLPLLARLKAVLKDLAPYEPSVPASLRTVEEFAIFLDELARGLMKFKDGNPGGPESLEAVEERLDIIDKLKRKYGQGIPEILAHLEAIRAEEKDLVSGRERLEGLDREVARSFKAYVDNAHRLSALRTGRAPELERLVEKEIALLGMKKAAFKAEVRTTQASLSDPSSIRDEGIDDVEFLISPNPGEELRPLRKIASGGELSRVMLALRSLGKGAEPAKTLIFDEIDAGIGGRTAEAVAEKLKSLARRHQVLCITHLPRIAASAAHHFRVEKSVERARTFTTVEELGPEERVEEIARLISGTRVTEASLQIAREMLSGTPDDT